MKSSPKYFIAAALGFMTLTGCSNQDDGPEVETNRACPNFTATIGDNTKTRAFDTSWDENDEIGITGVKRTNVCYHVKKDDLTAGKFTAKNHGEDIYFQNEDVEDFIAYYPWNNIDENAKAISADTRVQPNQKKFDFLWAKASGKKDEPNVAFSFAHRMAKVVFTVKPGNGMSYEEVKKAGLSLNGFRHAGTFDVTTGEAAATGEALDSWKFTDDKNISSCTTNNDNEKVVVFTFIFFPQKFDNELAFLGELNLPEGKEYHLRASIDFTSANREKDGAAAKNELVAGRQYNLSLTLHKTEITVADCVIASWNEVSGGSFNVD